MAAALAAVAGAARIHLTDDVDVELVAHQVGSLLGLRLRAASPTAIELVGPVDAAIRDRLSAWLDDQDTTRTVPRPGVRGCGRGTAAPRGGAR